MGTLVFDIETIGESWDDLDLITKKTLTRWVDRTTHTEVEHESLLLDIHEGLGFSPLTGSIVAIGLYDLERELGVVYYTGNGNESDEVDGNYTYKQRSELAMLTEFWDGASHYDTFVTFNGRGFDVPFIIHRSLIHAIRPTRNLMEGRYPAQQKTCCHIDLQDQMTFFGAMQRRPSLHLFCRAYGISSPKIEVGGDDVAKLFRTKKFRNIATYNSLDVKATAELYQKWKVYQEGLVTPEYLDY